jgi:hypothetical protein
MKRRDNLEDLLHAPDKKKSAAAPLKITLAEHSASGLVQVEGAEAVVAASAEEVLRVFALGSSRRTTAATNMNQESSRSHLIFSLKITMTNKRTGAETFGKLTLVDLAGEYYHGR